MYLTGASSTHVKDGWQNDLYLMDGTVLEDVTTDIAGAEGFYTYAVNNDDVYELTQINSYVTISGSNYDDGGSDYD